MASDPTSRDSIGYLRAGSRAVVTARGLGRGLRFLLHVVVGRILGPADFGIYMVALSALIIAQKLILLGLDRVGIRYGGILISHAGHRERARFLMVIVGGALVIGAAGAGIIAVGASTWARALAIPGSGELVLTLGLGLPLLTLFLALSGLLRGSHRPGTEAVWAEFVTPGLNILLLFALPFAPGVDTWTNLQVVAVAFLASHVLPTIGMGLRAASDYLGERARDVATRVLPPASEVRTFAIGVWTVGAVTVLLARVDRLLVAQFLSPEAVGLYAAAAVLAQQNAFFVQSIAAVAAPRFALLERQGDDEALTEAAGRVEEWTAIISMPVVLVTILLAPDLLGLLGPEFRAGAMVLVILTLSQAVNVLTGASGAVLNMTGGERDNVLASGIGLIAMLAMVSLGAARYGLPGAAFGSGVAWATVWVTQRRAMTRRTGPSFPAFGIPSLAIPTVAGTVAGVACIWTMDPGIPRIVVTGALTLAVYASVVALLRGRTRTGEP
ncbi:MAG TPA: oligosaccharide flippase family protein [Longimicrobiales bacterium]|nr:oligosaccharide flippase family protein [Longimicrobiales bacterium]